MSVVVGLLLEAVGVFSPSNYFSKGPFVNNRIFNDVPLSLCNPGHLGRAGRVNCLLQRELCGVVGHGLGESLLRNVSLGERFPELGEKLLLHIDMAQSDMVEGAHDWLNH